MLPRQIGQGPAHPFWGAHGIQLAVEGRECLDLLLTAEGQQCLQVKAAIFSDIKRQIKRHRSPSQNR